MALALLVLSACQRELEFTLTWHDAQGLSAGSRLTHNALELGKVTAVDIDPSTKVARVSVKLPAKHHDEVYREASYSIIKRDLLGAATGERMILMEDRGTSRTPIVAGDVIEGTEQTLDRTLNSITKAIDAAHDAVNESLERRAEEKSPDGQ